LSWHSHNESAKTTNMRKFNVKSQTQGSIIYKVTYSEKSGSYDCNCNAGRRNVACNHIGIIRKFINHEPMLPQDYERFEEIK